MNAKPKLVIMDNVRQAVRSEHFNDDKGQLVEKRCFLLCVGDDDDNSDYLNLRISVNVFDEPRNPVKVEINLKLS